MNLRNAFFVFLFLRWFGDFHIVRGVAAVSGTPES